MDKQQILNAVNAHHAMAWARFVTLFPELVRFKAPTVKVNYRLSSTAGRNTSEENTYDLAGKFFAKHADEMLRVILPHEIAHQIDFNLNGWYKGKKHHGAKWCAIMEAYGLPPEPYHSMQL
jgi:predicted SprT family Zn-dependent metalloprotease